MALERWGALGAFAMVVLFLFAVVIGPDFLYPAMGLPRPSATPADPATRLAAIQHPAHYIGDLAAFLLFASFILMTAGVHARLRTTAPDLSRLALVAAVIGGAVGMVGMMVVAYTRSAVAGIENPAAAQAAMVTTQATGIGIAIVGLMFAGGALLLSGSAALAGGGLPIVLAWLLMIDGALFILYALIAPLSPGFGGFAGIVLGIAAPLVTLVAIIWLGIVLWLG